MLHSTEPMTLPPGHRASLNIPVRPAHADETLENFQVDFKNDTHRGFTATLLLNDLTEPQHETVICAAILAADGTVYRCHRHFLGIQAAVQAGSTRAKRPDADGFITSKNRFVNREEGLRLQQAAGIPSVLPGGYRNQLYSEDLY